MCTQFNHCESHTEKSDAEIASLNKLLYNKRNYFGL